MADAVGLHVQKARVAWVAGRQVALLQVRLPGETLRFVVAEGSGVGLLGGERGARLGQMMAGAAKATDAQREAWGAEAGEALRGESREALLDRGDRIADALGQKDVDGRRSALTKALAKAIARVERRVAAVKGDLTKARASDELARRALLFVGVAARAAPGATKLVTVDWTSGQAHDVELPLDPARGAREQLDAIFRAARRRKEGVRFAQARWTEAQAALGALRGLADLVTSDAWADLADVERRAMVSAPRDFKRPLAPTTARPPGAKSAKQAPLAPYRTFLSASGARIWVGRGDDRNDALTFHIARPHDLWLHAKNRVGAHVVVPLDKGASCPADVLVDAAHLAAHFSGARDETLVEIQHTPRRYVRKPRGSPPGLVVVDREKVLVLRREDERLRALLAREADTTGSV